MWQFVVAGSTLAVVGFVIYLVRVGRASSRGRN